MAELNDHSSRAHATVSPSAFDRVLHCTASLAAALKYPSQDTVFTREGTFAHEIAEAIASGGGVEFTADKPDFNEEMVKYGMGYKEYLDGKHTTDNTLQLLETRLDMTPEIPECFGTADCIQVDGNTMRVIDYKYGKGVPVSAIGNPQMRLYAFGALKELEFLYDTDSIEYIETCIFQPRIDNISEERLTKVELLDWISNVAAPAAKEALSKSAKYHAGEWCHFCPHAGHCRELSKYCSEKVKLNGKTVTVEQLAPWEVADILGSIKTIKAWLSKVEDTALEDLKQGKEIPGYKIVEGKQGNRTYTDELKVYDHLIESGFSDGDITKKVLLTPADLDKMLGKKEAAKVLDGYVTRTPGKPTVVPESDKRPAYDYKAELMKDFD